MTVDQEAVVTVYILVVYKFPKPATIWVQRALYVAFMLSEINTMAKRRLKKKMFILSQSSRGIENFL